MSDSFLFFWQVSAIVLVLSMRGTEQVADEKPPRPLACVVIVPKQR